MRQVDSIDWIIEMKIFSHHQMLPLVTQPCVWSLRRH
jgi:hypothetical protein